MIAAAALSAADVAGKWDVTAQPQGGAELKMELALSGTADALTGTISAMGGSAGLQEIKLAGNDLSFRFPIGPNRFEVKVTIAGDAMSGSFTGPQGMQGAFNARRAGAAPAVKIETGTVNGSGFRIDIPANYNGELVVYCHGYGGGARYDEKPLPAQLSVFTDAGYAIAQAGYRGAGWAVKEAMEDTEALRRYFVEKHGKPKRTWITGHSMGGLLTMAILEQSPQHYDGALPLCGALSPSLEMLQRRVFDTLVVFEYYYPGVLGSPVKLAETVKLSTDYAGELQKIIDADPQKRAALQKYLGFATEKELGIGVGFFANIQKELLERAGGNAFDNRNTIYYGSPDDVALNRGVKRYTADAAAAEYVRHYYTATGRPARPMLAVHTVYDPIVPAWATDAYGDLVRLNRAEANFVQRWTAHPGHCGINAQETYHAFRDLVTWTETGKRPEAGEQK